METDLERFVQAQNPIYPQALEEIRKGKKATQWMWYIFPQLKNLGRSANSTYYGISSKEEAAAYLQHPLLNKRLTECCETLLNHHPSQIEKIVGPIGAKKLRSSMTLFDALQPHGLYNRVLQHFFGGKRDLRTLALLYTQSTPLMGAIAGDIIGSVYEINNIYHTHFPLFIPRSHYTDDSIMTLAVAQWLLNGKLTQEDLIAEMQKFGKRHPHACYGQRFSEWLKEEEPAPYNSWGNGAAMRVSAIGWYATTLQQALDLAEKSASVSHNHPEGIKGAQATAAAIFLARNGKTKEEIKQEIEETFGYTLDRQVKDFRPCRHFDVSCQGTLPQAFAAYFEGSNYEEVIRLAISIGGDSDTIAAIAGSIAAATYSIPQPILIHCTHLLSEDLRDTMRRFNQFITERNVEKDDL